MNHTENWIGSQYKKVVYREYTNGEFVEIKARPPREDHLQLLGKAISARRCQPRGWACLSTHSRPTFHTHLGIPVVRAIYQVSHALEPLSHLSAGLRNFYLNSLMTQDFRQSVCGTSSRSWISVHSDIEN